MRLALLVIALCISTPAALQAKSRRDYTFADGEFSTAKPPLPLCTNPRLIRFERQRDSVTPGSATIETYEGIIEIDYGSRITSWLALRPNLQYVINPGGTGTTANALIAGL